MPANYDMVLLGYDLLLVQCDNLIEYLGLVAAVGAPALAGLLVDQHGCEFLLLRDVRL